MDLSKSQIEIINSDAKHIVVIATAGAGKTTVLTERLKRILDKDSEATIVTITFTNNAADELRERIGGAHNNLFIGTVHAYANYLLLSHGIKTHDYLEHEAFDHLFSLVNDHSSCIKPIDYLLVDEAQDSTDLQFNFFKMLNATNWFFVGDHRQSIFQFNGAVPQNLLNLTKQTDVTTYHLRENYRCDRQILNFAKSVIRLNGLDYVDDSVSTSGHDGRVIEVEYSPTAIAKSIKTMGNYKDWFILCRTNDQVDSMCRTLGTFSVPWDTFKKKELTRAELHKKMESNVVKVLTIHSAKGLERKNVIVIGARLYNTEEKCISYVAATRAENLLVWSRIPTKPKRAKTTQNWEC